MTLRIHSFQGPSVTGYFSFGELVVEEPKDDSDDDGAPRRRTANSEEDEEEEEEEEEPEGWGNIFFLRMCRVSDAQTRNFIKCFWCCNGMCHGKSQTVLGYRKIS